jgi:hypothetical protein
MSSFTLIITLLPFIYSLLLKFLGGPNLKEKQTTYKEGSGGSNQFVRIVNHNFCFVVRILDLM